jgi:Leucine-rich repeat (LRR) protein
MKPKRYALCQKGCFCSLLPGYNWTITCLRFQAAVPKYLPINITISRLLLNQHRIEQLESASFTATDGSQLHVQHLDLSDNPITSIANDAFKGLDPAELKELLLDVDFIPFPAVALETFTGLTTLVVGGFSSTSLPMSALRFFTSLGTLKLINSALTSLQPDDVWDQSDSLDTLDLSNDGFTCVPTSALATLVKLRTLTLSSNLIDSLLITSFQRVAKLNYLDLAHNSDIVTIEIGTFDPLSVTLETANISDCNLNSTGVESISVLAGLRNLDLSYNLITTLTVNLFANLRKLAILNLEHNRLTFVTREVFAGLGVSMRELYLSANNITAIQPSFILNNDQSYHPLHQ